MNHILNIYVPKTGQESQNVLTSLFMGFVDSNKNKYCQPYPLTTHYTCGHVDIQTEYLNTSTYM